MGKAHLSRHFLGCQPGKQCMASLPVTYTTSDGINEAENSSSDRHAHDDISIEHNWICCAGWNEDEQVGLQWCMADVLQAYVYILEYLEGLIVLVLVLL